MLNKYLKNILLERHHIISLPGVPLCLSPACLPPIRTWQSQGLCTQSQSLAKVHMVTAMVFLVVMYRYKSWTIKKAEHQRNWCFWTVMLEKTLESPLDCKEIQAVHPKGNQSWIVIGRTDVKTSILWPPYTKSPLIGKDPDAAKDWRQEEKWMTEDEMVGWHHWLNGREFE